MQDELRNELTKIFKDSFGIEKLEDSMSIQNVEGWDSMAHVGLIMELQKIFNISITPIDAIELTDVKQIIQYLKKTLENNEHNTN